MWYLLIGVILYLLMQSEQVRDLPVIRDMITKMKIAELHPKMRGIAEKFVAECERKGFTVRITSALRTFAEQDALYGQVPKVTNARGGESYHNYGLAFDVAYLPKGKAEWSASADHDKDNTPDWLEIAYIGETLGLRSGRWWNDWPHFEYKYGHSSSDGIRKLMALHGQGKYEGGFLVI